MGLNIDFKEAFGIKHFSASSLNKWSGDYSDQGLWVMQRLYGKKFEGSPATERGSAVEQAFTHMLANNGADYLKLAQDNYSLRMSTLVEKGVDFDESKAEEEYDNIEGYIEQAGLALLELNLGNCDSSQTRVEVDLGYGVGVGAVGYLDYSFNANEETGEGAYCLDLKTTGRMNKDIKPDHKKQLSIYAKARGERLAKILYLTPKKWAIYSLREREIDVAFDKISYVARNITHMLTVAYRMSEINGTEPKEEMAKLVIPNTDRFAWDEEALMFAKENKLFNIT